MGPYLLPPPASADAGAREDLRSSTRSRIKFLGDVSVRNTAGGETGNLIGGKFIELQKADTGAMQAHDQVTLMRSTFKLDVVGLARRPEGIG